MPPDWEAPPSRGQQTSNTGELQLASGRCPSGIKIPEEGTGSNLCCCTDFIGDTQANRICSGPPTNSSRPAAEEAVRRKTNKQKGIASTTTKTTCTKEPHLKDDNLLAREQNWTKNEFDELTEVGFRRWVITNSSELKEHVLTQCKEAKNLEKMLEKLLTGKTSLEKNVNELMELKNTAQELHETYTNINSSINQAEERISEVEDQLNEIQHEDKLRETRMKRNKQSLEEIWRDVKRPKLSLIDVHE
ncbi:LINE-1 retrotransposable element ORF1 protein, partial [Plecturocebus cupreus]